MKPDWTRRHPLDVQPEDETLIIKQANHTWHLNKRSDKQLLLPLPMTVPFPSKEAEVAIASGKHLVSFHLNKLDKDVVDGYYTIDSGDYEILHYMKDSCGPHCYSYHES